MSVLVNESGQSDTYLHFAVDSIAAAEFSTGAAVVAPARTPLPVRTIASHVARVAANAADDARRVILTLRTVVLAMANLAAVLASLVLVVS